MPTLPSSKAQKALKAQDAQKAENAPQKARDSPQPSETAARPQARRSPACTLCGSRLEVEVDPNAPHTFYCTACLHRAGQQQRQVKAGWRGEEPVVE